MRLGQGSHSSGKSQTIFYQNVTQTSPYEEIEDISWPETQPTACAFSWFRDIGVLSFLWMLESSYYNIETARVKI